VLHEPRRDTADIDIEHVRHADSGLAALLSLAVVVVVIPLLTGEAQVLILCLPRQVVEVMLQGWVEVDTLLLLLLTPGHSHKPTTHEPGPRRRCRRGHQPRSEQPQPRHLPMACCCLHNFGDRCGGTMARRMTCDDEGRIENRPKHEL
jgi:hypothetical protein